MTDDSLLRKIVELESRIKELESTELPYKTNGKLVGIGVITPTAKLDVTDGVIRALSGSNTLPSSGSGVEIIYTSNAGYVTSYDRSASAYKPLNIAGSTVNVTNGGLNVGTSTGAGTGQIGATGYIVSYATGSLPAGLFTGITYDSANSRGLILAINGSNGNYQPLHVESSNLQLKYLTTKRIEINVTGIGFFNVAPVAQQTGGALTAAATYAANEQTMLNRVFTALRNYGLIT